MNHNNFRQNENFSDTTGETSTNSFHSDNMRSQEAQTAPKPENIEDREQRLQTFKNQQTDCETYHNKLGQTVVGYFAQHSDGYYEEHANAVVVRGTGEAMAEHLAEKYTPQKRSKFKIYPFNYGDMTNYPTLSDVILILDDEARKSYEDASSKDLLFNPPQTLERFETGTILRAEHSRIFGTLRGLAEAAGETIIGYTSFPIEASSGTHPYLWSSRTTATEVRNFVGATTPVTAVSLSDLVEHQNSGIQFIGDEVSFEQMKRLKRWNSTCIRELSGHVRL